MQCRPTNGQTTGLHRQRSATVAEPDSARPPGDLTALCGRSHYKRLHLCD